MAWTIAVVVIGYFREGVSTNNSVRIPRSFRFGVAEKIGAAGGRLSSGLYGFLFAFVADKIEESHGIYKVKYCE